MMTDSQSPPLQTRPEQQSKSPAQPVCRNGMQHLPPLQAAFGSQQSVSMLQNNSLPLQQIPLWQFWIPQQSEGEAHGPSGGMQHWPSSQATFGSQQSATSVQDSSNPRQHFPPLQLYPGQQSPGPPHVPP